jgi:hypothetical protein
LADGQVKTCRAVTISHIHSFIQQLKLDGNLHKLHVYKAIHCINSIIILLLWYIISSILLVSRFKVKRFVQSSIKASHKLRMRHGGHYDTTLIRINTPLYKTYHHLHSEEKLYRCLMKTRCSRTAYWDFLKLQVAEGCVQDLAFSN